MSSPKHKLLSELEGVDGFEALPSKVAGGTALFYMGKEFAHFHHDEEIDLRLTRKVIKSMKLEHPPRSNHHPTRSASSVSDWPSHLGSCPSAWCKSTARRELRCAVLSGPQRTAEWEQYR